MDTKHVLPSDIERTSMAIIASELEERGIQIPPEQQAVVRRVIHTSADFDYAENLKFTPGAVTQGVEALRKGAPIITDTNMALAGISKPSLKKTGGAAYCYMADPAMAEAAKQQGTTRAAACMRYGAEQYPAGIFAVGNAPTALITLSELIRQGLRPSLIIAVPVGFVNVTESKEEIFQICESCGVPVIAAMGRKGGSNVAAAICNALLYTAVDALDPSRRGWN
ncbi:hypothetical protein CXIVA_12240 [Clostridium sp. SY8519]|jgi:precorrin-8X/cobalt-precorrin-8 methylmutase|uniref:precorrin-8X methylmutase n=1 Tax=Clostridium sp. (strain SY8519) TaxID=1042156 RepID=UPI0002171E0C|nr:precorrin-8X methylmutase [Clostridium sp. SY8519]BAK47190.1 hypothetical protein CXIVA_12240 [Clostridium sp. SY8519]